MAETFRLRIYVENCPDFLVGWNQKHGQWPKNFDNLTGITYIIYLYRFLQHTFGPSILPQFPYETRRKTGVGEEIWNSRWWRWGPRWWNQRGWILGWRAVAGVPRVICVVGLVPGFRVVVVADGLGSMKLFPGSLNRWYVGDIFHHPIGRQNSTYIPQKSPCRPWVIIFITDQSQLFFGKQVSLHWLGDFSPTYFSGWFSPTRGTRLELVGWNLDLKIWNCI